MTEEEAALEGLFQTCLLTVLTFCPPAALSESSTGAELTMEVWTTAADGGGDDDGGGAAAVAAAATIWFQGEETAE